MRRPRPSTTRLTGKSKTRSQTNSRTGLFFVLLVRVDLPLHVIPIGLHFFSSDRLRTIIGYDRICVLDAGQIAEFDTPANLYSVQEGIFRSMCERSSISLGDIKAAEKSKEAQ